MSVADPATLAHDAAAYRRGVLLILAAGICWSLMGIGIRLMEAATAWQILFYRSIALAAFLFCVISVLSAGRPLAVIAAAGIGGMIGGLALVGAFSGAVVAIQMTTVANAMFLFAAAPFLSAILGLVILGEAVRPGTWAAMAVATVGIVIMVWDGISGGQWLGNVLALGSALAFAVFTIVLRYWKGGDMMPAVMWGGIFTALIAGAACLITGQGFAITGHDLVLAGVLGVIQVGLGLVLCTIGARTVPAAEVALLTLSEVVLGPLWVALILSEIPSTPTLIGGVILLAALALNALSGMRRRPPAMGRG
ncbi:MAG: DMT family transporter [Pseudomonadota bacterium]